MFRIRRNLYHGRHAAAILLFAISWKYLNRWYEFQASSDYWIFASLFAAATLLASFFVLQKLFFLEMRRFLPIAALLILFLPWGEWLQLNFASSRGDWSRQVFKQMIFVYGCALLFQLFPFVARFLEERFLKTINFFSAKQATPVAIPVLFFLFTSYIALFVHRQTPLVQDSAAHLFQASVFKALQFFAPAPPVPDFFSAEGDMLIIHEARWFCMYLPGYAMLLAAAALLRAEWLLSPLLGSLTVWIWMRYAELYESRPITVLLGILCLASPFLFLMFSTVMIHGPELFFASWIFFLARRLTESRSYIPNIAGLFLGIFLGTLLRGFSFLVFLAPALLYLSWDAVKKKNWLIPLILISAMSGAILLIAFYQMKTTGDPFLPAYNLEYAHPITYGFGESFVDQVHTPARALEQVSNHFFGINTWLTGWYSGSLFFLILFFMLERKFDLWDRILLAGIVCTILFYFFYVIQDLVIGPRFYFIFSAPLLLFIARLPFVNCDMTLKKLQNVATVVMVISLVSFLPYRLYTFVTKYVPEGNQRQTLQREVERLMPQKSLVFIHPRAIQQLVAFNDPFLQKPVLLLRDLAERNVEAMRAFRAYRPSYFRLDVQVVEGIMKGGYGIFSNPDKRVPGYVSLFEIGMALETARYYKDQDIFDYGYSEFLNRREAEKQWNYLQDETIVKSNQLNTYKDHFRMGIVHAARTLLIPKKVFERSGKNWKNEIDLNAFRKELEQSESSFQNAETIGKTILAQIQKVRVRIDKNRDKHLSDDEILDFLEPKTKFLELQ